VDFDRVEQKNTQAQFHTKMSLGKNKAQALSQAFLGLFGAQVASVPHKLVRGNAKDVLGASELVLDCTDNIEAREVIILACRLCKVPCLHGALAASGDFARLVWDDHFVPDAEGAEAAATCIDGEHLPFFAAAAAFMAIEAQRFLRTGKKSSYQLTPAGVIRLA
jgi:molybdopterin/thiamine biosynthesis adenylyltransferase